MSGPLVKICGITRAEDADAAVALGASAVGFIFWPKSPRYIEPAAALAIVRRLPAFVTPVGVFVNETADTMNAVADVARLGAIQLHGDESPSMLAALQRPVIRALSGEAIVDAAGQWPAAVTLLIDAHDPVRRGGTGRTVDWTVAARVAATRRVVLSGGLNADNIAAAIATVRPFGIDVSSGVEQAPGVKDHEKLAALFAQLRGAGANMPETGVRR